MIAPRDVLSIYYLQGKVSRTAFADDPEFLGNWEEEGHAFLFFSRPSLARVERLVQNAPELRIKDHFRISYQEWLGMKVQGFEVGPLRVLPIWEPVSRPRDGEGLIRLPPFSLKDVFVRNLPPGQGYMGTISKTPGELQ